MFVHDFIRVDKALDDVVTTFGGLIRPRLPELVGDAYAHDRGTWIEAGVRGPDIAPPAWVAVEMGVARVRDDSIVVPLEWRPTGGRLVASVDADLQMTACGLHHTDVDILGRYRLAQPVPRLSQDAVIARRVTMTALRRFLESLSEVLTAAESTDSEVATALPA